MTVTGPAGLVIAVEGPSGSGQPSAAARAPHALGLRYLDSWARDWIDLTGPIRTREVTDLVEIGTTQIGRSELFAQIADRAEQRTASG